MSFNFSVGRTRSGGFPKVSSIGVTVSSTEEGGGLSIDTASWARTGMLHHSSKAMKPIPADRITFPRNAGSLLVSGRDAPPELWLRLTIIFALLSNRLSHAGRRVRV